MTGDRPIRVRVPGAAPAVYEVRVGQGLLERLVPLLGDPPEAPRYAHLAVISDRRVGELYGERVCSLLRAGGAAVSLHVFPGGEASKNRATVAELQDALIAAGARRDGAVVALGGGVVGDVAGFVAATLYRGLPWLQLPTSLLAMVDSSVGGKTGVDVPAGKNLVGAFHQPLAVIADVSVLDTLPERELGAGLAEVIKTGAILDEQLFVDLEDGLLESCVQRVPEALVNVIERAVRAKADVVQRDPLEGGYRQVLNFGHTVGHALEAVSGYALLHGEAVALGMIAEARIAARMQVGPAELEERLVGLCARAGLPTRWPADIEPAAVVAAAGADKKVRGGELRCALPGRIGEVAPLQGEYTRRVPPTLVAEVLAELRAQAC